MIAKLEKYGDDFLVRFPLDWAAEQGYFVGDYVEVSVIPGVDGAPHRVIIKKLARA